VPQLAAVTLALQQLFQKYSYSDAIIFGHALDGNLHMVVNQLLSNLIYQVFSQALSSPQEVSRYQSMMQEMCEIVVTKFNGR
jgi:D-lactate dehydrogenase